MKWLGLFAFIFLLHGHTKDACAATINPRGVVILVPGTFNSITPGNIHWNKVSGILELNPYYSEAIVKTIEARGYPTFTIKHLRSVGDIKINGAHTLEQIRNWYLRYFPNKDVPITLLGHSMGAFYSLWATHLNRDLPIKNIISVSAPLQGVPLINLIANNKISVNFANNVAAVSGGLIDFRGITQSGSYEVDRFMSELRIDIGVRIFTIASAQERPFFIWETNDAQFINPWLSMVSLLMRERNDGLIPLSSAYGEDCGLLVKPLKRVQGVLDHQEQIWDYRILAITGFRNALWVRAEQIRFYNNIFAAAGL